MAKADWKYLQYNIETGQKRTGDGPGGGASSLSDLDDTNISSPSDGQMLGYDETEGKWKNVNAPAGSVSDVQLDNQSVVNQNGVAKLTTPNIDALGKTAISNPADGEMLGYDETEGKWKNVAAPGGNVDDVEVNGVSVVNAQKVAEIKSYKEVTQAQYEALPDTKLSDGILYAIKDGGQAVDGFPPLIYSDEEREIGVWRDGKPLYERVFETNYVPVQNDWVNTGIDATGIDKIISFIGHCYGTGYMFLTSFDEVQLYNNMVRITCGPNGTGRTYNLSILRYTKTTDTPGSGTWTTQGKYAHHYSTTEHVVGTWIDGKPLYERSFTKILANSPDADSSSFLVASNVTGIETLVKIEGTIKAASAYAFAPVCGLPVQIGWNYAFHINPTNQLVVWTSNTYANYSNIAGGTAICTLQYTKTTD